MSRTLSLAMLVAIYAQQTSDVIIPLLTIEHPDMEEEALYFALNTENVTSRGNLYLAFPFDISVPDDTADSPPQAVLSVSNVDRRMAAFLEQSVVPPTITIEIIRAVDPDVVEVGWAGMTLRNVKYNRQDISGSLTYERMQNEGYPKGIFSPTYFPGMF